MKKSTCIATRPQKTSTMRGVRACRSVRLITPKAKADARSALSETGPHNDQHSGVNTPGMASPTFVVP